MKIRPIHSPDHSVNYECVRPLTEMQRRALRGEFQDVAIATVSRVGPHDDRSAGTAWSRDQGNVHAMLGTIERLKIRYNREVIDDE